MGIQLRLMLGLLSVFAVSLAVVNVLVAGQIERSYEEQIAGDLQELRASAAIYTRQLLVSGGLNNEEEGFQDTAPDILGELLSLGYERVAAYTTGGRLIDRTRDDLFDGGIGNDLESAMNGRTAFTLIRQSGRRLIAQFSCRMDIEGKTVGILRFELDYSARRQQGELLSRLVFMVTLSVFIITFLAVEIMARRVTSPVLMLARHTTRVADASEEVPLLPEELRRLEGRQDEIGRLAVNYGHMLETIREQMARIRRDRDRIRQLYQEKQALFNNVTHELKTPLTTIQGYADLLEQNGGRDPVLFQKGIRHIGTESRRLHEMVVQLLEMADRTEQPPADRVELASLVRGVVEAMEPKARRYDNRLSVQVEDGLSVKGYAGRLWELTINLLDNAVKYGDPGGTIEIRLLAEGECALLKIANRGLGLTCEQREKIFDPFYQADKTVSREPGSAGLGLPICQKIAEEHGGSITVESTPGAVTEFTVTLPLWKEAADPGTTSACSRDAKGETRS
ncbi:MAG: HAMP domain-containing histidine kinase [Clostridiales bacterium]|nr:HAMP domain-containing histidine kinase [Clostridiales bacterium]